MERGSGLGPALQACDLRALGVEADAGKVWCAALCLPAMGDANAPDVAKRAHQHVLWSRGLPSDDAWVRFGHGFGAPTGCSWQGVYGDDRVTVGVVRRSHRRGDLKDCENLVRRSEAAYPELGLTCHAAKEVRGASEATVWGTSVEGPSLVARSDAQKACQVISITAVTTLEGYRAGRVLRRLAGIRVRHLLMRRPYLCLSQETFAVAEAARPWKGMVLPRGVAEELCLCCLLASEAVALLDAPLSPTVSATDASFHHGAFL